MVRPKLPARRIQSNPLHPSARIRVLAAVAVAIAGVIVAGVGVIAFRHRQDFEPWQGLATAATVAAAVLLMTVWYGAAADGVLVGTAPVRHQRDLAIHPVVRVGAVFATLGLAAGWLAEN